MSDFGLKEEVLSFIVSAAHDCGLEKVVLFGSRAKGTFSKKSDIDLAVCGGDVHGFMGQVEEECPTLLSFDFIDLSDEISASLAQRISDEGVKIYG